jgi:sulfur carrier protein ThiS
MKVYLVPVGIMKKYMKERDLDIGTDLTAGTLIERLNLPDKLKIICFLNGKRTDPDYRFTEGDVVKIVSTFAGG